MDNLLTVEEVAELLRLPAGTLRSWRAKDVGPRSFKIGRRVVYYRDELEQWIRDQAEATTRGGTGTAAASI